MSEGSRKKNLFLFPFGGNAREALLAVFELNRIKKTWNILGFLDDDSNVWGREHHGLKVLGGKEVLADFPRAQVLAVPGNPENFLIRRKIIERLDLPIDRFATIIVPNAVVAPDAKIGRNTIVMSNVFISCSVEIGNHCVVLPNTVISHETRIGDYSIIGSNVSISSSCTIGRNCYIGSGARIRDHLTIHSRSLIGLGSCVIQDVAPRSVVAGNPARLLRETE